MSDNLDDTTFSDEVASPGTNKPETEHETHVPMLLLLVVITLAVIAVVFWFSQETPVDRSSGNVVNTESITTTSTQSTYIGVASTSGYIVPTNSVETISLSGRTGLPDNLPAPENISTVRNYRSPVGAGNTQRVFSYDTDKSTASLVNTYQRWLSTSDFVVTETSRNQTSATIKAEQANDQLIVSVSTIDGTRRVQINYFNR